MYMQALLQCDSVTAQCTSSLNAFYEGVSVVPDDLVWCLVRQCREDAGRLETGQVAKRAVSKTSGLKRGSSTSAGTQGTD